MDREVMEIMIKLAFALLSVIISGYIIPLIKSKADSTKYNDFLTFAKKCVEAANQIYTVEEWKEKKLYVIGLLSNYAADHNVDITTDELNAIIEGFVKAVKGN